MGYSSEFGKNAASGGPFDVATKKGNSPRPQNYIGEYVTDIKYRGDGKQAVDPAPQQGFRKELPPIRTGSEVVSDYEPAEKLTIDDVYNKSKRSFGWKQHELARRNQAVPNEAGLAYAAPSRAPRILFQ